ncbi:hypothetical protein PIB30_000438 [Stylosanthes scabra]|uniref:Uncharacterized protein n=1 Tax=Stylosanthes scabra TaxID=79078 RepID=A0ABU6V2R1_9FABA|nr:hypothetical protein [Stylosanthes scabra]
MELPRALQWLRNLMIRLRCSSEGSEFCKNEEVRSSCFDDGFDGFVVKEPPNPLAMDEDHCVDVERIDVGLWTPYN